MYAFIMIKHNIFKSFETSSQNDTKFKNNSQHLDQLFQSAWAKWIKKGNEYELHSLIFDISMNLMVEWG